MIFAYLDEFGHIGPFDSRYAKRYKESPVFGLAGFLLPEPAIRGFATFFLKRKEELLGNEIRKSGKHAAKWEKKGSSLFTPKSIAKYPEVRHVAFRILKEVDKRGGKIFYYGREKLKNKTGGLNSTGFYTTVFAHTIRNIDRYCSLPGVDENFVIVVDQHSARKELLECAAKTMFGADPARRLCSPPFEVESYLNQNIQAADWLAAIIGRIWAYKLEPNEFSDHKIFRDYFEERILIRSTHSSVMKRAKPKVPETALGLALARAGIAKS